MQRAFVESTTLRSAGHDPDSAVLELQFRNRAVYQYLHVPQGVYRDLMAAPSKGGYFNHHIRGKYPYKLIQNAACAPRS